MTGAAVIEIPAAVEVAPLIGALAAHAVPGLEITDRDRRTHTRLIATSGGPALTTIAFGDGHVSVQVERPDAADEVVETVRTWFDLDTDLGAVRDALGADSVVGPLIRARPSLRIPGSVDGFETAVLTVLGQQVSLAAARTLAGRLVAGWGSLSEAGFSVFPTPAVLAAVDPEELRQRIGLTTARARTLFALAGACAGGLRIDPSGDHATIRAELLALPGIGPWTVDYLAVRVLRDRDAYPAGDLVLQRALGVNSARQAVEAAEGWRPWRAYGLFHLWTAAAYK
ncbi:MULTISPECIES: AlkA N-terminal domain-containing protein [unclassified Diaminobutyricimonas]|uniref:DNA-3-methyladenine glycosylase family protein n=1 Tax=unclassified Diaminobutyricimonas TaxID=2643261 RepID=UPI0012F4E798|nr:MULTISPECIES: AlkA N-terminal domain-containing protein [unclassified Diaminobutyricimonas]